MRYFISYVFLCLSISQAYGSEEDDRFSDALSPTNLPLCRPYVRNDHADDQQAVEVRVIEQLNHEYAFDRHGIPAHLVFFEQLPTGEIERLTWQAEPEAAARPRMTLAKRKTMLRYLDSCQYQYEVRFTLHDIHGHEMRDDQFWYLVEWQELGSQDLRWQQEDDAILSPEAVAEYWQRQDKKRPVPVKSKQRSKKQRRQLPTRHPLPQPE